MPNNPAKMNFIANLNARVNFFLHPLVTLAQGANAAARRIGFLPYLPWTVNTFLFSWQKSGFILPICPIPGHFMNHILRSS
jgi:hypothetical protein